MPTLARKAPGRDVSLGATFGRPSTSTPMFASQTITLGGRFARVAPSSLRADRPVTTRDSAWLHADSPQKPDKCARSWCADCDIITSRRSDHGGSDHERRTRAGRRF